MVKINLTKGLVAIVDDEDSWVAQWRWTASIAHNGKCYPLRRLHVDKREQCILLHRVIAGAQPGEDVHHVNGDTLDNRRCNLLRCKRGEHIHIHAVTGRERKEVVNDGSGCALAGGSDPDGLVRDHRDMAANAA